MSSRGSNRIEGEVPRGPPRRTRRRKLRTCACACVCVRAWCGAACVVMRPSGSSQKFFVNRFLMSHSFGLRLRLLSHVPLTICIKPKTSHLLPGFLTHLSLRSRCFHAMRSRASVPRSSAPVAGCRRARSASAAAPTERFGGVKERERF